MTSKQYKDFLLPRSFYERDTVDVARDLLGKYIVRHYEGQYLMGQIVETEAYRSDDSACHAYNGMTKRNCAMFGPVGHAYVYLIHGIHYCLNIIARTSDYISGGVLIRAIEPVAGIETMMHLRKTDNLKNLTNGPGKLTQALAITLKNNHHDVTQLSDLIVIDSPKKETFTINTSSRIGISSGQDKLWRFFIL